ncbi:unnamed protein product [Cunninghamella blakesleeana]
MSIETRSANLMTIALDCLGKFITYNYLGDMENEVAQNQVMEKVVDSICDCFIGEETDEKVQLQIVKALLDAVYSTSNPLHQSALLKAVRTTYNIFLLSRSSANQNVAQVTLTQMVDHIFRRVKIQPISFATSQTDLALEINNLQKSVDDNNNNNKNNNDNKNNNTTNDISNGTTSYQDQILAEASMARDEMDKKLPHKKDTSEELLNDTANVFKEEEIDESQQQQIAQFDSEKDKVGDTHKNEPSSTLETNGTKESSTKTTKENDDANSEGRGSFENDKLDVGESETEEDLYIKDAILVFRALCKLSKKPISSDWGNDMRSYSMRSKLLSLHLILTILTSHMRVFTSPGVVFSVIDSSSKRRTNPFILEVKQYLCPSLGRNAFSMVPQVFDITMEILWKVIQGLKAFLKKEVEVFFREIILRILEMRTTTYQQKFSLLNVVLRMCEDPQTLVDIYLNYDCDRQALDNIYERLVNVLSKITTSHAGLHGGKEHDSNHNSSHSSAHYGLHSNSVVIPPPLTTATVQTNDKQQNNGLTNTEGAIKSKSLECLVGVLRSLVTWYNNNSVSVSADEKQDDDDPTTPTPRASEDIRGSTERFTQHSNSSTSKLSPTTSSTLLASTNGASTPRLDDPEQFENLKHKKQLLQEGVRLFNWKPKKGVAFLDKHKFLDLSDHQNVAQFLLTTEGLNKTIIGEYLGEADEDNISIMHAFVDEMDFTDMKFTEALRYFLQAFRLPGEGQKIDRFMLKFAERYVNGNPNVFSNAETVYVLSYSVIMLNTDSHNPSVKRRMTLQDFIKNNSGIDDGKDIAHEFQEAIFNEIQNDEIKLKDEVEQASTDALLSNINGNNNAGGALGIIGLQNALVNAGITRDLRKEAFQAATEEMGSKTEAMFKNMLASKQRDADGETITFYSASHVEHVRPMFEVAWMAFLAGISGPLQESDDLQTVHLCLEGFKHAIRIICLFHTVQSEDMDLQRDAFVTTLTKFTFLSNLNEMKPKNVEAIRTLLEVAAVDGNYLKGSWKEILSTVSQLERFQLITSGVDEMNLPDIATKRPSNVSTTTGNNNQGGGVMNGTHKPSADIHRRSSTMNRRANSQMQRQHQIALAEEVASAGSSQSLILAADRLFTSTVNLNGVAIVDFVRALCETSWEEIVSSAHLEHPRMYSLQKLVEISYYNMNRIRMEWSNMWAILGDYFNKVGSQSNIKIAIFALDSLRQLAMKFLEKEELPHFKFQKDFLMPFHEVLANNPKTEIKDMVLRCLSQMILARAHHIRSGWKTMLSVFAIGARESSESIVHMTYDIVRSASQERFQDIVANGTFPDYISCLVEFSRNKKFQKISLPALDMIKGTIPKMLDIANNNKTIEINDAHTTATLITIQSGDDFLIKFWFAVLYGLKEVTMQSDDVEVRKRSLEYLFETLKTHGSTYTPEFWSTVSRQIVFPLFDDLNVDKRQQRNLSPEDLSVWLSTTMIEALRNVVDLYTFYFDNMKEIMQHVLALLGVCITQDNDTLARIGCECMEQYIEANVEKFDENCWDQVTDTFKSLFEKTTAYGLFDDTQDLIEKVKANSPKDTNGMESNNTPPVTYAVSPDRHRQFQQVIVKCVLQLMLIQTVNDLLSKDNVYCAYPSVHLMKLMRCLEHSFHFAKKFNLDTELRMALWQFGFMKQLPNLLKQETSSGGCYVAVLMRMYSNIENISDRDEHREDIEHTLIPLCNEIFTLYMDLDHETKPKNIAAWTPVVVSILNGLSQLQDEDFVRHVPQFYLPAVELLRQQNLLVQVRTALRTLLVRVGKTYKITPQ